MLIYFTECQSIAAPKNHRSPNDAKVFSLAE